ncbi:MAG: hypothetical protein R2736_22945 [Solirubrobacterales bacterium]
MRAPDGILAQRARYHVCWGSWNAPHVGDGRCATSSTSSCASPSAPTRSRWPTRHEHEWQVWRDVRLPEGRKLGPGRRRHVTNVTSIRPSGGRSASSAWPELVGRENVIAGTDCGFAQGPYVQRVHPTIQWAKLEAPQRGRATATQRLWR